MEICFSYLFVLTYVEVHKSPFPREEKKCHASANYIYGIQKHSDDMIGRYSLGWISTGLITHTLTHHPPSIHNFPSITAMLMAAYVDSWLIDIRHNVTFPLCINVIQYILQLQAFMKLLICNYLYVIPVGLLLYWVG